MDPVRLQHSGCWLEEWNPLHTSTAKYFGEKVIIGNSDTSKLVNCISAWSLSYPCLFMFKTHRKSAVRLNDVTTFARQWALKGKAWKCSYWTSPPPHPHWARLSSPSVSLTVILQTSFYYYHGWFSNARLHFRVCLRSPVFVCHSQILSHPFPNTGP